MSDGTIRITEDDTSPRKPRTTFFSLPRELRDQIYELVILSVTSGSSVGAGFSSIQPRPAHKICIKGNHISRQFRAEFLTQLHHEMPFMIFDYRKTPQKTRDQKFVEVFGPSRIPMSRTIQFCGGEFRGCIITLQTDRAERIGVRGHIIPLEDALRARIAALAQDVALEEEGLLSLTLGGVEKLGRFFEILRV